MAAQEPPARLALVVHPARKIDQALETLNGFAAAQGMDVVQIPALGAGDRQVATAGELQPRDLVVALGGDGTVLSALRAAAPGGAPVLGVACGSLGALTAVPADDLSRALDRVLAGDWTPRRLPALGISLADEPDEWGVNGFVVVRRGAGQLLTEIHVDDELYARLAGDGLIVATPLGSSAYSMAAGGPVIVAGTPTLVCTPLAMHGGNAPPLVVHGTSEVRIVLQPTMAGFDVEIDGHVRPLKALEYHLSLYADRVTLVSFGHPGLGLTGLRERRLVTDSPRVLARDDRASSGRPL